MLRLSLLLLLTCAASALALPFETARFASLHRESQSLAASLFSRLASQQAVGVFTAPAPTDLRGPCPFINMLANHGYLPRNGKGITETMLSTVFNEQLGTSPIFGALFAKVAFNKFKGADSLLNLDSLLKRVGAGGVEHDASQSRADKSVQPDQSKADPNRIEANIKAMGKSTDTDIISFDDIAKLRATLNAASEAANPKLLSDPTLLWKQQKLIATAEACLLLGVASGADGKSLTVANYRSIMATSKFPVPFVKSGAWFGYGVTDIVSCVIKMGFKKEDVKVEDLGYFA